MFELQEIQQFIGFSNLLIKCDTGTTSKVEPKINENQEMNRRKKIQIWNHVQVFLSLQLKK